MLYVYCMLLTLVFELNVSVFETMLLRRAICVHSREGVVGWCDGAG